MKKLMLPVLAGLVISCASSTTNAQEFKENITREFTLQKEASLSTLAVYNLGGSIHVEGYSGNKIVIEIEKTISADNNALLETGKKEIRLEFEQNEDSIIAYIAEPFDLRPNQHNSNSKKIEYSFNLNYNIKVPFGINLRVSTITEGDIRVDEVSGDMNLMNVNGSINANHVKGKTEAFTVSGDIVINYNSNPQGSSSYKTISGDIRIEYLPDLSADMQFKSMQGEFYTDFAGAEVLPATAVKNSETDENGTVYKLEKTTTIRIGKGNRLISFETLSGNVYIKKQS